MNMKGMATLSLVFVLTAIILLIVVAVAMTAINQNFDSVDTEAGLRARSYADGAIKEALLRLARDYTYDFDEYDESIVLDFPDGEASFRIVNESDFLKRIIAQGQSGEATKVLQAMVQFDEEDQSHQTITWPNQREFPRDCALADLTGDGIVDESDGELMTSQLGCDVSTIWLPGEVVSEFPNLQCYHLDLNLDGEADQVDYNILESCYN